MRVGSGERGGGAGARGCGTLYQRGLLSCYLYDRGWKEKERGEGEGGMTVAREKSRSDKSFKSNVVSGTGGERRSKKKETRDYALT